MNIFMKFVLVAVLGMALPAWAGTASKTLLVYEVINQQPNAFFHFSAYVAAPLFSANPAPNNPIIGSSYSLSNNLVPNAGGIGQMPMVPDNPVPTQTALTQAGSQIAQQNYAVIAQAMTAYMAKSGLSSGIFNFQQQVMIQGNPKPGYLIWQMLVDAGGRANFGDMQFVTNFPILLYGLYTSQTVDSSLPASFAYLNAGTLRWEPIQLPNNNPLLGATAANFTVTPVSGSSMQTFNVGSTFDTPQSQNSVAVDPDWGLECLINHTAWTSANATAIDPACPNVPVNGYTDFMTLLNAQGASAGYLDYVRTLTPVYNAANIPQISVDVTNRTMTGGGQTCTFASSFCAGCWGNGKDSGATQISCPDGAIPAGWIQVARCLDYAPVGKVCQIQGDDYTVQSSSFPPIAACPVRAYGSGFNTPDCTVGTLSFNGGGAVGGSTYTNSGTIGYKVQSVADRYYVTPDGAYTLMAENTGYPQAPTQPPYLYSVTLPSGATPAGYANQIIDPFGTDQVYDYTNDTVNGLPASAYTVAPIQ